MFDDIVERKKPFLSVADESKAYRGGVNDQKIKIFNQPEGLCFSCQRSWIYKDQHSSGYNVFCAYHERLVSMPETIEWCNRYSKEGDLTLQDFKELATAIDPNDSRLKQVGFQNDVTGKNK